MFFISNNISFSIVITRMTIYDIRKKNIRIYISCYLKNIFPQVEPVFELALQDETVRELFPPWLSFEWMTYDVTDCDAAYAVISAIDAFNDCAHVFFGPSCDYALGKL